MVTKCEAFFSRRFEWRPLIGDIEEELEGRINRQLPKNRAAKKRHRRRRSPVTNDFFPLLARENGVFSHGHIARLQYATVRCEKYIPGIKRLFLAAPDQ